MLSFGLDSKLPRVQRWDPETGRTGVDPDQYVRLSPFDPSVRRVIGEIYEDLARMSSVDGVLYHDDAVFSDFEDAGPAALKVYAANGLPTSIAALRDDPAAMQRWTRFKSRYLIDFTRAHCQGPRDSWSAGADSAQYFRRTDAQSRKRSLVRPEPGRLPRCLQLDGPDGHAVDGKADPRAIRSLA